MAQRFEQGLNMSPSGLGQGSGEVGGRLFLKTSIGGGGCLR